jgi:aspartate carbamoyltransferase catalytic subunit
MSAQSFSNCLTAQRERLIKYLKLNGSITTAKAREKLAIMHPAGRIFELRARGYPIETQWANEQDLNGITHRQALYVLLALSETKGESAQQ